MAALPPHIVLTPRPSEDGRSVTASLSLAPWTEQRLIDLARNPRTTSTLARIARCGGDVDAALRKMMTRALATPPADPSHAAFAKQVAETAP